MDPYSQLKPLLHAEQLNDLRRGVKPVPVHVQLILSDLCNQDCGFCAYRMSTGLSTELFHIGSNHNPNRKIATEKALEILDDCADIGVKAIQFTGGGEPTVHKDHLAIFAHAQSLGLKTALVTNGVRLKPDYPIMAMSWIRVSVDAGTPATYAKVRNVPDLHWDKVWTNLESLHDYDGNLGIGFVVTKDNQHEIAECAKLAQEVGADNMRIGAVFSSEGSNYYDTVAGVEREIERAKTLETDEFKIIDLFGRRISNLDAGNPDEEFCGYQYFTAYIGADLNVYRCCNTAYTKKGKVGSLENMRFRDFTGAYAPFDARNCTFCQFIGQNKAINAALNTDDPEFV